MCFLLEKLEFWAHCEFCTWLRTVSLRKGPEYLYWLLDILVNQATCAMKSFQAQLYIQQKFTFIDVSSDRTLWMYLIVGGRLYFQELANEVKLYKIILVQLSLIVFENYLVLSLLAEWYIMKIRCLWFIVVCHTGIHCPE